MVIRYRLDGILLVERDTKIQIRVFTRDNRKPVRDVIYLTRLKNSRFATYVYGSIYIGVQICFLQIRLTLRIFFSHIRVYFPLWKHL